MSYILNPILSYILLYKYTALFSVIYSANLILPLPVSATFLAIGAFSSQGYFSFWVSLAVGVLANVLGDLTGYWITRKYGEEVIRFLKLDRLQFFANLKKELKTDAAITVFTTRFAGSLGPVVNFLSGLVGVPFLKFLAYDFLGNVIELGFILSLGYAVGNYWSDFSNLLGLITGIFAVGIITFILWRIYRRIMKKYY